MAAPYLSFNKELSSYTPPELNADVDASQEIPLENEWVIWEQFTFTPALGAWDDTLKEVGSFRTVQGFWKYWNNIPQPSQLFFDGNTVKRLVRDDLQIETLAIFKKGIKPAWEDEANARGGEFQLRKYFDAGRLDELWNNMILALVGETIDPHNLITGARVIDKTTYKGKDKKQPGAPMYRIELWFRDYEKKEQVEQLKQNLVAALTVRSDGTTLPIELQFDTKSHSK